MSISSDQTGVIMLTYMYSYKRSAYEQPVGKMKKPKATKRLARVIGIEERGKTR